MNLSLLHYFFAVNVHKDGYIHVELSAVELDVESK